MTSMNGVIEEHGEALLSYVIRITGDRYLAEDVVQETWLRAWRHLDRLHDGKGSVRSWLLRVARNVAIDLHRARRARPAEIGIDGEALADVAVQSPLNDEVEDRMVVDDLLGRLSPPHRKAVVEVFFVDRTAKSAAGALGVPVGTVKSRLHNAIRMLRESAPARSAAPAVG